MTERIAELNRRYERQVAAARYWLIGKASSNPAYYGVVEAMEFAKAHHNGTRNGGGPEFMHQVEIFHLLRTLHHHLDDPVTAYILAFLHDCIEDPQKQEDGTKKYIGPQDITDRWGVRLCDKLLTMSKEILGVKNLEYNLDVVFNDPNTALVKLADRCHNISTMMGVFKRPRAERYVKETVEEFLPRAKSGRRKFPAQEGAFENLKLILNSQLALIDLIMPTYTIGSTTKPTAAAAIPPYVKFGVVMAGHSRRLTNNENPIIGLKDGRLLVSSKVDFDHFKSTTADSIVVMGSNTFKHVAGKFLTEDGSVSLPAQQVILPNRYVVVLTSKLNTPWVRNKHFAVINPVLVGRDTIGILAMLGGGFDAWCGRTDVQNKFVWVCGGATLYEEALKSGIVDVLDYTDVVPTDKANADIMTTSIVQVAPELVTVDNNAILNFISSRDNMNVVNYPTKYTTSKLFDGTIVDTALTTTRYTKV